jgi:hypothetical protein
MLVALVGGWVVAIGAWGVLIFEWVWRPRAANKLGCGAAGPRIGEDPSMAGSALAEVADHAAL